MDTKETIKIGVREVILREGGPAVLTEDLPVTLAVGGVPLGRLYATGTPIEQILRDLLNPTLGPTFIEPKVTLSSNIGRNLYGFDESIGVVEFTLSFSRGTISTGGYRAGEATEYTIDGQSGETVTIDMDAKLTGEGSVGIMGSVKYAEGDQPKDSAGNDYGDPLPAGSVTSNTLTFTKKPYIYSTKSGMFDRMPIEQYHSSPTVIELSNGDGVSSPFATIAFPAQATKIEVYNDITNKWQDCDFEFNETTITLDGRTYYQYEDNRGYTAGDRQLKFTW